LGRLPWRTNCWLKRHHLKPIPIETILVLSNPSTRITDNSGHGEIKKKVIHAEYLSEKVKQLENLYTKQMISSRELQKISQLLVSEHSPLPINILIMNGIPVKDLIKGVQCPHCSSFALIRNKGTWLCPTCHKKSPNAHRQAIHDYLLLINPTITNKQCCEFLQLLSRHASKRLLTSMELPTTGSNTARKYHLPDDFSKYKL
jgi:hypothetical protein